MTGGPHHICVRVRTSTKTRFRDRFVYGGGVPANRISSLSAAGPYRQCDLDARHKLLRRTFTHIIWLIYNYTILDDEYFHRTFKSPFFVAQFITRVRGIRDTGYTSSSVTWQLLNWRAPVHKRETWPKKTNLIALQIFYYEHNDNFEKLFVNNLFLNFLLLLLLILFDISKL